MISSLFTLIVQDLYLSCGIWPYPSAGTALYPHFVSRNLHSFLQRNRPLHLYVKGEFPRYHLISYIRSHDIQHLLPHIPLRSFNADHSGYPTLPSYAVRSDIRFRSYLPSSFPEAAFQPGQPRTALSGGSNDVLLFLNTFFILLNIIAVGSGFVKMFR